MTETIKEEITSFLSCTMNIIIAQYFSICSKKEIGVFQKKIRLLRKILGNLSKIQRDSLSMICDYEFKIVRDIRLVRNNGSIDRGKNEKLFTNSYRLKFYLFRCRYYRIKSSVNFFVYGKKVGRYQYYKREREWKSFHRKYL